MEAAGAQQSMELREEIIRLGPWHMEVQVTPDLSTAVSQEAPKGTYPSERVDPSTGESAREDVSFINPRRSFTRELGRIYPDGLDGRSFLDCACNCGGYSFWAKEAGAGECLGFDVRDHWVDQARFLAENRTWPSDGMRFEVLDLYQLPELGLEPFDITNFQGIFYHLPDPVAGLKLAADLTREVIIVSTAVRNDLPDGMLALSREGKVQVMTGVYGLNWRPTGPRVMTEILEWLGFPETRLVRWRTRSRGNEKVGRIRILAARKPGMLDQFESVTEPS